MTMNEYEAYKDEAKKYGLVACQGYDEMFDKDLNVEKDKLNHIHEGILSGIQMIEVILDGNNKRKL